MVMLNPMTQVYPHKLRHLYAPFLGLAEHCPDVIGTVVDSFQVAEQRYTVPRFSFLGPAGNVPQRRIGLFALVHGDEPAGAYALLQLLQTLVNQPALARGYDLVLYPVCNPTGYEDGTRHNRAGFDLNREFWRGSAQPEVHILEGELTAQNFDGIIALHADDTSDGLYGYAHGWVINENLLVPALLASEKVLPRNRGPVIDGFAARDGIICDCFTGVLTPPPAQKPRPFEIIFETPARALLEQQIEAAAAALETILAAYRGFIAYAANL
ncbi:MAG: succinylglutamate desuccinylase/aspartoacylase family protein [Opitutaceae bacterium]|nr:succinylglutamate desuccinylase/aspartoacylase family protein [Opitutaceae bacterium]